jgi:hypothetical protein
MAISAFARSKFQTVGDSGFARAKKLAALAIKTNTDSSGSPTVRGYEQAITYLQPYISSDKESDAISAQTLIAGYGNNLDRLSSKKRDQSETVAAFKLQELDSYFTSSDGDMGSFRNPASLIGATSESVDSLLLGVINAIDEKQANGDSTDTLQGYMNDLSKRADTLRDLRNKFEKGELTGKTLDGFGYYVDTNPLDGSVRGAALLPVGLAPEDLSKGYRRLEATTDIGGALLPVYAPAQQNDQGEYTAKIGDATWSGTGSGALQAGNADKSKNLFQEGGFNISDGALFPVRKTSIDKGSFARGFAGRDLEGNPVEAIFYRGADSKLYSVDQTTIENFKKDPLLSKKLDGYVAQFSPTEMQGLAKEAVPFNQSRVGTESYLSGLEQDAATKNAEADRMNNLGFFGMIKEGASQAVERARASAVKAPQSFFENRNAPNKPDSFPTGGTPENIIETGKQFFRKAAGFFSGQPQ